MKRLLVFVFIFQLLFSFGVYAASSTFEPNTNRPGMDYRSFKLYHPNPNLCKRACERDVRCKAWTYVKPHIQGPTAMCWLKNRVPNAVKESCCVSGVKVSYSYGFNLTGVWSCDDGGKYYIRQVGSKLWWYGESNATHPSWSNVAYGTVSGNVVNLRWVDVPKGSNMLKGTLKLRIDDDDNFHALEKTGGFGGSSWHRLR